MRDLIHELVVGLFPRSEAADDPGIGNRKYAIIVPFDKHETQESLQRFVNDSSRTEHSTLIISQIVSSWLDICFHAMSDAVVSELRIIALFISKLEMVLTFEEEVDVSDVGAPLTHLYRRHLLIVILEEITRLPDDISVAVAWGLEFSLTNG